MHSGGKWKLNYIFLSSLKNNLPKLNCVRNASHSYGRPLSNMARPPKLPAFSMINLVDGHGHRCDCNVQQSRRMSFSLSSFPWSNRKNDLSKDDPLHHKLIGLFLLRRVLKNFAREEFDVGDFIQGVKGAIQLLADCICTHDKDSCLQGILGPELHAKFRHAFTCLKMENKKVLLEIEALTDFKMSGIRLICGNAEEGDEYVLSVLGQKIITSKRDMFELEKRVDSTGYTSLFQYGKQMGMSAAEKQLRFQIDVKFTTNERFYVQQKRNDNWEIEFGGRNLVTGKHKLRFESCLQHKEETADGYPLSWRIVNIDFVDDMNIENE